MQRHTISSSIVTHFSTDYNHFSTGIVWNSRIEDMEETLKEADRCMYVEKDKYHKMTGGVVL